MPRDSTDSIVKILGKIKTLRRLVRQIEKVLSNQRLASYRRTPDEELGQVLARYQYNVLLCESLYPTLHYLEVCLRNAIHDTLSTSYGTRWFRIERNLRREEIAKIAEATESLRKQGKDDNDPGRVIAELRFGFWTSLLDLYYEKVWHQGGRLRSVFPHISNELRTRKNFSTRLNQIRRLRNRVFHYEPIWHWRDLADQHSQALEALAWLSKDARVVAESACRFKSVYGTTVPPIELSPTK